MLVEEDVVRTEMLAETLFSEGFNIAARMTWCDDLIAAVKRINPDILVIDMEEPEPMIFEQLIEINTLEPIPVVFFAEKGESQIIQKAVKAGVSAFVVDGLTARRIKPVIDLAIARFKEIQSLHKALDDTRSRLEERKLVERAKGILMKSKQISEDEAYQLLRKLAMEKNKKLADIAKTTIEMSKLFS